MSDVKVIQCVKKKKTFHEMKLEQLAIYLKNKNKNKQLWSLPSHCVQKFPQNASYN